MTDPTGDDVRKLCMSMRRNAKDERVLFHYNGHGVPRPTQNGEIWVFNKNFTQVSPRTMFVDIKAVFKRIVTTNNDSSNFVVERLVSLLLTRSFPGAVSVVQFLATFSPCLYYQQ